MITVSLMGGLGNQMFQYAAGKALAERHGVRLALDISGFRADPLRSFLLDRLLVPEGIPTAEGKAAAAGKALGNFHRAKWRGRIDRLLRRVGQPPIVPSTDEYREPHFHYDPIFEQLGSHTTLFGYFQSERYFAPIAEQLRDWFSLREPVRGAAAEILAKIEASHLPVSVHVRRGDYLNPGTAEFHGVVGELYYRQALGRLEQAAGEAELFVFSDDAAAAERVLNFVPKPRLVHVRGTAERPWEDMTLMARCRHHVIANSSFSWWGAWLNGTEEKQVIAPRQWFAPAELKKLNTADLYPAGWIVV